MLRQLLDGIEWEQHQVTIFGRQLPAPRLSAWYGDPDARYTYSGLSLTPRPWTEPLSPLKTRIEAVADDAERSGRGRDRGRGTATDDLDMPDLLGSNT